MAQVSLAHQKCQSLSIFFCCCCYYSPAADSPGPDPAHQVSSHTHTQHRPRMVGVPRILMPASSRGDDLRIATSPTPSHLVPGNLATATSPPTFAEIIIALVREEGRQQPVDGDPEALPNSPCCVSCRAILWSINMQAPWCCFHCEQYVCPATGCYEYCESCDRMACRACNTAHQLIQLASSGMMCAECSPAIITT